MAQVRNASVCALRLSLILMLLSLPVMGAPKWVRRATLIAACAASGADAYTTYRAGQRGAQELNPLLRSSSGGPSIGRILGLKSATCVAAAISQERMNRRSNVATVGNIGATVVYALVAARNN